jgi:hypothetical protein
VDRPLWENVDSGLLLLVCLIIKLITQLQRPENKSNALRSELVEPQQQHNKLPLCKCISKGAKEDAHCGTGILNSDATVLEGIDDWGDNQLGHVCLEPC